MKTICLLLSVVSSSANIGTGFGDRDTLLIAVTERTRILRFEANATPVNEALALRTARSFDRSLPPSATAIATDGLKREITIEKHLRPLDDHNWVDARAVYRSSKDDGYSDEEIREGLLRRIHQQDWPKEQRAPSVAIRAAGVALFLFPGDPVVEKAVLEAHRPDQDHYLPEYEGIRKRGLMWQPITTYGSDELIKEFEKLERDDVRKIEEKVSARQRFHRGRAPEELKPGNRPTERSSGQANQCSVPRSSSCERTSKILLWPLLLGVLGCAMTGLGCWRKRRALSLGGILSIVIATAFLLSCVE